MTPKFIRSGIPLIKDPRVSPETEILIRIDIVCVRYWKLKLWPLCFNGVNASFRAVSAKEMHEKLGNAKRIHKYFGYLVVSNAVFPSLLETLKT